MDSRFTKSDQWVYPIPYVHVVGWTLNSNGNVCEISLKTFITKLQTTHNQHFGYNYDQRDKIRLLKKICQKQISLVPCRFGFVGLGVYQRSHVQICAVLRGFLHVLEWVIMVVLVLLQLQRKIVKQRQTRRRQERGDQKKRVPEKQFFLGWGSNVWVQYNFLSFFLVFLSPHSLIPFPLLFSRRRIVIICIWWTRTKHVQCM